MGGSGVSVTAGFVHRGLGNESDLKVLELSLKVL